MDKCKALLDEYDRTWQKYREIQSEYINVWWIGEGEKIPESKHPTQEVSQELERLEAKLQELRKQIEKADNIL